MKICWRTRLVPVPIAIGLTLACQRNLPSFAETRTAEERAVREADAARSRAFAARDIEGYISFFTEDALVLTVEVVKGKASIRRWVYDHMTPPGSAGRFQATHVEASRVGDMAYVVGTYHLAWGLPVMGGTSTDHGTYVTVWKKQENGAWRAVVDSMNSNVIPPPRGAAID